MHFRRKPNSKKKKYKSRLCLPVTTNRSSKEIMLDTLPMVGL